METYFYVFAISPKTCINNCFLFDSIKVRWKSPYRNSVQVCVKRINVSRWLHGRWIVSRDKMPKLLWSKPFHSVLRILKYTEKCLTKEQSRDCPWYCDAIFFCVVRTYMWEKVWLYLNGIWYPHAHFADIIICQSILSVLFPLYMFTWTKASGKLTDGAFIPRLKVS